MMGFYKQMTEFGARFDYTPLRKVCVAAVTYAGDGSDVATWDMATFEDGTHFVGQVALEFMATHEFVVLQHWNRQVTKALQARGVKVLLWAAIEAIENGDWAGRDETQKRLREYLWLYRLVGTNSLPVNLYEGQSGKVAWAVDMYDVGTYAYEVANRMLAADFGNGFFIDSTTRWSYFGTATNPPPLQDRTEAWKTLVKQLRQRSGIVLWGNTVGPAEMFYGLDVEFAEQYFYEREIEQAVAVARAGLCINTQRSSWASAPERWKYLAHGMSLTGIRDVWVCTAWTGQQRFLPVWR